jgi:hypothetical protein
MSLRSVLIMFAATIALSAAPAKAQYRFAFQPGGNFTCGTWTAAKESDPVRYSVLKSWVWGYVSRAAYAYPSSADGGLLRVSDADAASAYVDLYCADHPLETYMRAAAILERELVQRAQMTPVVPTR